MIFHDYKIDWKKAEEEAENDCKCLLTRKKEKVVSSSQEVLIELPLSRVRLEVTLSFSLHVFVVGDSTWSAKRFKVEEAS